MKKILAMFAALTIGVSSLAMVISCGTQVELSNSPKLIDLELKKTRYEYDSKDNISEEQVKQDFYNDNPNLNYDALQVIVSIPQLTITVRTIPEKQVYENALYVLSISYPNSPDPIAPDPKKTLQIDQFKFAPFEYNSNQTELEKTIRDEFLRVNDEVREGVNSNPIDVEVIVSASLADLSATIYVDVTANNLTYEGFHASYDVKIAPEYDRQPLPKPTSFTIDEKDLGDDPVQTVINAFKINNAEIYAELDLTSIAVSFSNDMSQGIISYRVKPDSTKFFEQSGAASFTINKLPVADKIKLKIDNSEFDPFEYNPNVSDLEDTIRTEFLNTNKSVNIAVENNDVTVKVMVVLGKLSGKIYVDTNEDNKTYIEFHASYDVKISPQYDRQPLPKPTPFSVDEEKLGNDPQKAVIDEFIFSNELIYNELDLSSIEISFANDMSQGIISYWVKPDSTKFFEQSGAASFTITTSKRALPQLKNFVLTADESADQSEDIIKDNAINAFKKANATLENDPEFNFDLDIATIKPEDVTLYDNKVSGSISYKVAPNSTKYFQNSSKAFFAIEPKVVAPKQNIIFEQPREAFNYGSTSDDVIQRIISDTINPDLNPDLNPDEFKSEIEKNHITFIPEPYDDELGGIITIVISEDSSIFTSNTIRVPYRINGPDKPQTISNVIFDKYEVNDLIDDIANIPNKVQDKIKAINSEVTQEDYKIEGLEFNEKQLLQFRTLKEGDNVEHGPNGLLVKAKEGSTKLKGSFSIQVYKDFDPLLTSETQYPNSGSIDESIDVKNNLISLINKTIPDVNAWNNPDYVLTTDKNDSWNIISFGNSSRMKINFSFSTIKASLYDLQADFNTNPDLLVTVGETFEGENGWKEKIVNKVNSFVKEAKLNDDYIIDGNTENGDKQIQVIANPNSKRLTGGFSVNVHKIDISDTNNTEFDVLANADEIKRALANQLVKPNLSADKIASQLNVKIYNESKVFGSDKDINRIVRVDSIKNSPLLTGNFEFNLNKLDLANAKTKIDLTNLSASSSETEVKNRVQEAVKQLFVVTSNDSQESRLPEHIGTFILSHTNNVDHSVTWAVSVEDSVYLKGGFEFTLSQLQLKNIISENLKTINLGDKTWGDLKKDIQDDIDKNLGREGFLEIGIDYEVRDNATNSTNGLINSGEVEIVPLASSNKLSQDSKVTINVIQKDVTGTTLFDGDIVPSLFDDVVKNLEQTIETKLNVLFKINNPIDPVIKVTNKDYKLYKLSDDAYKIRDNSNSQQVEQVEVDFETVKNNKGNYILRANVDSKKITGEFNFTVGPVSLDSDPVKNILNNTELWVGYNRNDAVDNIVKEINKLVGSDKFNLVDGMDYTISVIDSQGNEIALDKSNLLLQKGTLKIIALDTSTKLSGQVALEIKSKSIESLGLEMPSVYLRNQNDPVNGFKTIIRNKIQDSLFSYDADSNPKDRIIVKDTDFEILDNLGKQINITSGAGDYTVRATTGIMGSQIISDSFILKVLSSDIAELSTSENPLTYKNMGFEKNEEVIKEDIKNKLSTLTADPNANLLKEKISENDNDFDYGFYGDKEGLTPADFSGPGFIYVIANAKKEGPIYINGLFSFEIEKFNPDKNFVKENFNDADLLEANAKDPDAWFNEILNKLRKITNIDALTRDDFIIPQSIEGQSNSYWNEALKSGQVVIKANPDSNYFEGSFTLKTRPVSLKNISVGDNSYKFGLTVNDFDKINYDNNEQVKTIDNQTIHKYINQLIKSLFSESYATKYGLFDALEGVDYQIRGLENRNVDIAGANGITILSKLNNHFIKDSFAIAVTVADIGDINNKSKLYTTAGNNYLLTSTSSSWGQKPGKYNLPIIFDANDILGVSDSFLVTTKGIYYTNKLLSGSDQLNLTANDLLWIDNNTVITTKGGWYIEQPKLINNWIDYTLVNPKEIPDLNLNTFNDLESDDVKSQFLGISNNLIVTTRGIWSKAIVQDDDAKSNIVNWKKIQHYDDYENLDQLTSYDVLVVNDNFLITRKQILVWINQLNPGENHDLISKYKAELDLNDISSINNYHVYLNDIGMISSGDSDLLEPINKENVVIAQTNNYTITKTAIYWQGQSVETQPDFKINDPSDILLITDDWLIIKDKPGTANGSTYYHTTHIKRTTANLGYDLDHVINKGDIIGVNSDLLVLKEKVQYKDQEVTIDRNATNTEMNKATNSKDWKDNGFDIDTTNRPQASGMGTHFLNIKGKNKYFFAHKIATLPNDAQAARGTYWVAINIMYPSAAPILFTNNYAILSAPGSTGSRVTYYFDYEQGNISRLVSASNNSRDFYKSWGNFMYYKDGNASGSYRLLYKGKILGDKIADFADFLNTIISVSDDRIVTKTGVIYKPLA